MSYFDDRMKVVADYYDTKLSTLLSKCNIPYSTYQSLSYHGTSPSITTLKKIINILPEVSFEWLATGKGNMIVQQNETIDENNPKIIALKRQVEILSDRLIEKERRILELELIVATYVEK